MTITLKDPAEELLFERIAATTDRDTQDFWLDHLLERREEQRAESEEG